MIKIEMIAADGTVAMEATCTMQEFLEANEGNDEMMRAAQYAMEGQEVVVGGGAEPLMRLSHAAKV